MKTGTFSALLLLAACVVASLNALSIRVKRDADDFPFELNWLSESQQSQLDDLDDAAKITKLKTFFDALDDDAKKTASDKVVPKCYAWLNLNEEDHKKLDELHAGGKHQECKELIEKYKSKLSEEKQTELKKYWDFCEHVWYAEGNEHRHHHHHRRRRHEGDHVAHHGGHTLEDYFKTHLSWLSDDQKEQLRTLKSEGKSKEDLQKKVFEFFEATTGETKDKATEQLRGGCRELLKVVVGEEKATELKTLRESGASKDELEKKVDEFIAQVTDEHKKEIAREYGPACKRLFDVQKTSRKRREHEHGHEAHHGKHTLEDYFKTHLSWLSDDQKEQLRTLKSEGKTKEELQKKVFEFFEAATGETKEKATEQLKGGCRELLKVVVGDEKATELKTLRESGASADELEKKVTEFLAEVTDEHKKEIAKEYGPACKKLFGVQKASRKRRDHHEHHKLEDYLKTHLDWLTGEQKEEVRKLKADGTDKMEIQKKVMEFYEATTGETREKATEQLKGGCRHLLKDVIGEEMYEEIKKLKESGASMDDIAAKMKEYVEAKIKEYVDAFAAFVEGVEDADKKEKAKQFGPACKKIFSTALSRRRRDHHEHKTLEDFIEHHLTWLTDEQKQELKKLKAEGKPKTEIQEKVFQFYQAATGETKTTATEQLKQGCRELLKNVLGEEKAAEIKKLKEEGKAHDEIEAKIKEYVDALTDEDKKQKAAEYGPGCKRIFTAASRKRRDHHEHHHHTLEDYITHHLAWLTDEQKEEVRKLKADGKDKADIQQKVLEFYDAATGETKTQATEQLKAGCRELIKTVIGEDKAEELKKLKESGASADELEAKVNEFVDAVTDEDKKQKAKDYGPACKKIFRASATQSRRRRNHHHHHTLEEYFKTHLSWLTDEQKEQIRTLKADGKSKVEIQQKVLEFYDAASGETKEKATELLKSGCRELLKAVIGEEKANEVKKLKESGTAHDEIEKKINEWVAALDDDEKKDLVKDYGPACKKIFAQSASRKRRDHHEHTTLEDFMQHHLTWLTDEQKEEVKKLKADGKPKTEIQDKIFEFFQATTGETKTTATEQLKEGCRELLKNVLGEEKAAEIKKLKEEGKAHDEIEGKIKEYVDALTDATKKEKAAEYGPACKRVFTAASRKRRDHHHGHTLEDYFKTHLSWLTEEQKEEVKNMKADGKDKKEIHDRVMEFYESASGETKAQATEQLKGGCRHLLKDVIGEDKYEEIKKLKESGSSLNEIDAKITELIEGVDDAAKKEKAKLFHPSCKKIFGTTSSRKRRDHHEGHQGLEDYLKSYLGWLTDEQKEQIRTLKAEGKSKADLQEKVLEFYDAATGETKDKATESLKGACRNLLKSVVGDEKAEELKKLRESGASKEDIAKKADEFISAITDEDKKKKVEEYGKACKKIFGVETRRRRHERYYREEDNSDED